MCRARHSETRETKCHFPKAISMYFVGLRIDGAVFSTFSCSRKYLFALFLAIPRLCRDMHTHTHTHNGARSLPPREKYEKKKIREMCIKKNNLVLLPLSLS